ncbi:MAG: MYXO-CTERM sorting domain-containing protein [Myxococcota bacterium]
MTRGQFFHPSRLAVAILFAACSGDGCSCDGCGVDPIPGGFDNAQRIPNSTQLRLTGDGVEWIEDNADDLLGAFVPGGLTFEVPPTSTTVDVDLPAVGMTEVDINICEGGGCNIAAEVTSLDITTSEPSQLGARVRLALRTENAAGMPAGLPTQIRGGCVLGFCAIDTTCDVVVDTSGGSRPDVGLIVDLAFEEETTPPRDGYTKITVINAMLDPANSVEGDDVSFSSCSGLAGSIIGFLEGFIVDLVVDGLTDQVDDLIGGLIDEQLCTTQGTAGCPTGTVADAPGDPDAVCRFTPEGECVPALLGVDGQGDLGQAFLGGISPGTHAPAQYLFAGGGAGEATDNGLSLFFHGGFIGTSRDFSTTPANNPCVPTFPVPDLPSIERATFVRGDSPGGEHLVIGVAESFLNHAGYGFYDSGMLCIGAGTPIAQELSTGLFSLLVPSLSRIAFPARNAPLAIVLRPQAPLNFEVGEGTEEDPLLSVALDDLEVDFYVWGQERFVRFMTYRADLVVPLNLSTMDGEIVVQIPEIQATDSSVTNHENLLTEDPEDLAMVVQDLIGSLLGMALGDLGFELDLGGVIIDVPDDGFRGIEEGGEEFLGIFANLAVAPSMSALVAPTETRVEAELVSLDERALALDTWGQGALPVVRLSFEGDGPLDAPLEYSYRLDGLRWSEWTTESTIMVESRTLLFQAEHRFEARARVQGEIESVDLTPAVATVTVDIRPPDLEFDGVSRVTIRDVISDSFEVRYRTDAGWSDWWQVDGDEVDLPEAAQEVEVRDESGNVGRASSALIRGRPNPAGGGGCDCSTGSGPAALGWLVVIGLVLRRRH